MEFFNRHTFLTVLLYFFCLNIEVRSQKNNRFELSIIHYSDFHARFAPVSPSGGLCYEKEKCVGGIARVASIVRQLKKIRPNPILLNAGDNFQGTLYFELHRGNITAYFMNQLPQDAMAIGNHDFDDEISGLASFVKQLETPVVATNIDYTHEPLMRNLFTNSTIIRKGGKDIGVIGVIASNTDKISDHTGKLIFLDEVETVNLEAKALKAKGVNIIVVLSHCGIEHDKILANNCPDVDIIVGGHSHILLYNGNPPSNDIPYDKYPIVVTQKENRKVLIVHSGAFTKYMGDIRIAFDDKDEVSHWKGNPIYLDHSIQEDSTILQNLIPWTNDVDKIGKRIIGRTQVFLNGSCSTGECNLANLITDAMIYKYVNNASISLESAISIQNSIPEGLILYEDIYMTLPYNNTWDLIELQGKDLLQVLEENVASSMSNKSFINPLLLQWSGLQVVYNLTKEGSKVINVKVRSLTDDKKYESLNKNKWYKIVVDHFLLSSYYKTISEKHRKIIKGKTVDINNLIDYIKLNKTVNISTESRMIFV